MAESHQTILQKDGMDFQIPGDSNQRFVSDALAKRIVPDSITSLRTNAEELNISFSEAIDGGVSPRPFMIIGYPDYTHLNVSVAKNLYMRFRQALVPTMGKVDIKPYSNIVGMATYRVFEVQVNGPESKATVDQLIQSVMARYGYVIYGCIQFKMRFNPDELRLMGILSMLRTEDCLACQRQFCVIHRDMLTVIEEKVKCELVALKTVEGENVCVSTPSKFTEEELSKHLDNPCCHEFYWNTRPNASQVCPQTRTVVPLTNIGNEHTCCYITIRERGGKLRAIAPVHDVCEVIVYSKWSECEH